MPFDDFLHQFSELAICRVINTSMFSFSKTWHESRAAGSWATATDRAGGCRNHPDSFLANPQYRFDIDKDGATVILQLSQSDVRGLAQKTELLVIGFHIMRVELNRKYRLHRIEPPQVISDYIKTKHIFLKTTLPRGRYAILPTTFKYVIRSYLRHCQKISCTLNPARPGETTSYLLRMFTESDAHLKELELDEPKTPWYKACCASPPVMVTRIRVRSAEGLEKQDTFGSK